MNFLDVLQVLIIAAFLSWMVFGPFGKKERAQRALARRGYCPRHFKLANIHKAHPENGRCFSVLCEDCLPEYEEKERKRLEYLMKTASK